MFIFNLNVVCETCNCSKQWIWELHWRFDMLQLRSSGSRGAMKVSGVISASLASLFMIFLVNNAMWTFVF